MSQSTILIVEDDEELLQILKIRIEALGHQTLSTNNGEDALKLAQEKLPDLVILDIFLPDMDGLTLLRRMRAPVDVKTGQPSKTREIPIVVITGKAPMIENMTRIEGASDFFIKPVDLEKLSDRIKQLLAQRRHESRR